MEYGVTISMFRGPSLICIITNSIILRMDDNCPPFLAMKYVLNSGSMFRGRSGRPRITLLNTIQADLKLHNVKFDDVDDFEIARS